MEMEPDREDADPELAEVWGSVQDIKAPDIRSRIGAGVVGVVGFFLDVEAGGVEAEYLEAEQIEPNC